MKLYLVRHGQAVIDPNNPDPPLSDEGKSQVEAVAKFLSKKAIEVTSIFHSDKQRARQTAEIIANYLDAKDKVGEHGGLHPNDPVMPIAREIYNRDYNLMFVGHLPFMSRLVGCLLSEEEQSVIGFDTASIACLEKKEGEWSLQWFINPTLVEDS